MEFYLIAGMFLIMALSPLLFKEIKWVSYVNIFGTLIIFINSLYIMANVYKSDSVRFLGDFIYVDSLSVIQLLIITSITFIAALYSHKYIMTELKEKKISLRKAKIYYFLLSLFIFSMIFLCLSNNVMGMWIGLEATTLSTAFLIGFNNNKLALEAAWKYIIICSIGIGLGLVGIILLVYSAGGQASSHMLSWTYLTTNYPFLKTSTTKIAFTFIFIGIGTKAGLAPMHTWLSDGHSEAPSPISAMMSGILLNLAVYVILRFYAIVSFVKGTENLKYLFIAFGCISLIISAFSILRQSNYKRLLAFSSVENIGIITLGIGFGGPLGIFGALLHGVIHAYGKTLLFLTAGNILSSYKTKRIDRINGLIKTMPKNSVFFILGMLVITGAPPFASFFSEYNILMAGIERSSYLSVSIYAFCLLLVFAGFLKIIIKMIFEVDTADYVKRKEDNENIMPLAVTFAAILFVSITFGSYLLPILEKAASIIGG